MGRSSSLLICALPLVGACLDGPMADDCHVLLNCPLPAPQPCAGTCVPLGYGDWHGPFLAWLGDDVGAAHTCPAQAPSAYIRGGLCAAASTVVRRVRLRAVDRLVRGARERDGEHGELHGARRWHRVRSPERLGW